MTVEPCLRKRAAGGGAADDVERLAAGDVLGGAQAVSEVLVSLGVTPDRFDIAADQPGDGGCGVTGGDELADFVAIGGGEDGRSAGGHRLSPLARVTLSSVAKRVANYLSKVWENDSRRNAETRRGSRVGGGQKRELTEGWN
jgi:hypothetical protein